MRIKAILPEGHTHHRILHLSAMHVCQAQSPFSVLTFINTFFPVCIEEFTMRVKTNSRNADVTHPITILMCTCKSKFAKNSKAEKAKNISENIIHQLLL